MTIRAKTIGDIIGDDGILHHQCSITGIMVDATTVGKRDVIANGRTSNGHDAVVLDAPNVITDIIGYRAVDDIDRASA